jgi:cytochrome d ubiquinol oxidase subunit I
MDHLVIARSLFGTTMAVHIIFATIGVGLPMMILTAEILYQKTADRDYSIMAKRWTKAFAIILGVSIPTGTIAGVQLSLLWPGFMKVIGTVMTLPFQIEIYAFFLEALFMSIYVYAAERISPWMRNVSLFFVVLGGLASAVLITNVHAFEGTPTGFDIKNGIITNVDPWAAFFNPSFFVNALHVAVSAYIVGGFIVAMVAAYKMIRSSYGTGIYRVHQKALMTGIIVGGLFSLLTAFSGHETAQYLHEYQPEKLAAAEGLFKTQSYAPLTIGGYTDRKTESVKWGIEVPWALSFLAGNRFDTVVQGLNDFPEKYWPPLIIHTLFNAMVGIGSILILFALIGYFWRKILKKERFPNWLLWTYVACGPLSILGIEFGWIFACTGRQPWTIYHKLSTADSVTTAGNLGILFILFVLIYMVLAVSAILVLLYYFKRNTLLEDLNRAEQQAVSISGSNS